ncbi:hypothetical protein BB987_13790 [Photorhabdus temperata]|nr:hypothetical protein BB987_13790 [Photorhabdus temperata]
MSKGEWIMDLYQRLNKTFFNSCSTIDKSWQKIKRTIDTKLIVLFLMKIISGKIIMDMLISSMKYGMTAFMKIYLYLSAVLFQPHQCAKPE